MRTTVRIRVECRLVDGEQAFRTRIPRGTPTPMVDAVILVGLDGRTATVEGTLVLDDAAELIDAETA